MKLTSAGISTGLGNILGLQQAGYEISYILDDRDFVMRGKKNFLRFTNNLSFDFKDYLYRPVDIIVSSPSCAQVSKLGMKRMDRQLINSDHSRAQDFEFFNRLFEVLKRPARYYIIEYLIGIKTFFEFNNKGVFFIPTEEFFPFEKEMNLQSFHLNLLSYNIPQNRNRLFFIFSVKPSKFVFIPPFSENAQKTTCGKIFEMLDSLRKQGKKIYNDEMPRHTPERIANFDKLKYEESYYGGQNNKRLNPDKPSFTITSSNTRHVHPWEPRVLNVRECAILQGFPLDFEFYGKENICLDLVGKTVSPPIIKDISGQIKSYLELENEKSKILNG